MIMGGSPIWYYTLVFWKHYLPLSSLRTGKNILISLVNVGINKNGNLSVCFLKKQETKLDLEGNNVFRKMMANRYFWLLEERFSGGD